MENALRSFVQTGPPAPTQQQQQQQFQQPVNPQQPVGDQDWVTGADMRREAQGYRQTFQQDFQSVVEMGAQNALAYVKAEFPDAFAKYGPTIYSNLATITDKRSWNVDNLRKLVKYSLADHVDEIAGEKAQRLAAEMVGTLRSTGVASLPVASNQPDATLKSDKLPSDWKKRAADAGLDERSLDAFLAAQSMSREAFFAQFDNKGVITEVSPATKA